MRSDRDQIRAFGNTPNNTSQFKKSEIRPNFEHCDV